MDLRSAPIFFFVAVCSALAAHAESKILCDVTGIPPSNPFVYQSEYDANGPFLTFIVSGKDEEGDFIDRRPVLSEDATCFAGIGSLKDTSTCQVTAHHEEILDDPVGKYSLDFHCENVRGHLEINGSNGDSSFSCNLLPRNISRGWGMTNCRLLDSSSWPRIPDGKHLVTNTR